MWATLQIKNDKLLVEDNELFRLGPQVRLQREPGLEIIAEAEDGETAIDLAKQQEPNVVLMNVGLPGIGGVEACRHLKQQHPQLPILILTSHSQPSLVARLIEAGAQGYCLKGVAAEKLVLALRSVAAGASCWDRIATQEIRATFENHAVQPLSAQPTSAQPIYAELPHPLTQRELEILALLATGKTNQEIAAK